MNFSKDITLQLHCLKCIITTIKRMTLSTFVFLLLFSLRFSLIRYYDKTFYLLFYCKIMIYSREFSTWKFNSDIKTTKVGPDIRC